MNILAICGSPKKLGTTSTIAKEILSGAEKKGHTCKILYLSDLKLLNCTGCIKCRETQHCIIRNDDIGILEETFREADVMILASPVHWGNISSLMLNAFERMFGFLICEQRIGFPIKRNGKGKKAILVTSCSTRFPFDIIFNQTSAVYSRLKEICRYSGIKIIGKISSPGMLSKPNISNKCLSKGYKMGFKINLN